MNLPNIEMVAAVFHDSIVAATTLDDGERTLKPYANLSDAARSNVRDTVRAVYAAIEACTIEPVRVAEPRG